jgi:hypothetical protein
MAMACVLALALGATSAVFTIVNALLLRRAPYPDADRLLVAAIGSRSWSPAMLRAFETANTTFDRIAGVHERAATLTTGDAIDVIRLEAVTSQYFEMLGIRPPIGAVSGSFDDPRASPLALISSALWHRTLGRRPDVLGRRITIDERPFEVAGVLPHGFRGLVGRTDVWIPLEHVRTLDATPGPPRPWSRWFEVIGRVRKKLTITQALASFDVESRAAMHTLPGADAALGRNWRATLTPLAAARGDGRLSRASGVLAAAVATVLVLAAFTLGALQVVTVLGRARELAVRRAVGGSSLDLVALIAAEVGLVLAAASAGAVVARRWMVDALVARRPGPTGFGISSAELVPANLSELDLASSGIIVAGAVLAGFLILVLSILALPGSDVSRVLGATALSPGPAPWRTRRGLVAAELVSAQVAMAVLLLSTAGLMGRSAWNLWSQDRGFDPDGVMTVRIEPPDT